MTIIIMILSTFSFMLLVALAAGRFVPCKTMESVNILFDIILLFICSRGFGFYVLLALTGAYYPLMAAIVIIINAVTALRCGKKGTVPVTSLKQRLKSAAVMTFYALPAVIAGAPAFAAG